MKEDLIRLLDSETMWANEMIGKASAMLKNAPPGELRVIRHHTNYQYYHSLPSIITAFRDSATTSVRKNLNLQLVWRRKSMIQLC